MVYSSLYFCVGEGQGMEELAKTVDVLVKNWLMVLWSLTHSLFSLSLALSPSISLSFSTLSLSRSYLSHSQPVSPLFLPVHFVIPNRNSS